MKTNTNPKKRADPRNDWSVQDLYDLIMYDIEPELLSPMIPNLEEMYRGESPEQREARMEHYRLCFLTFYERFDMLLTLWKNELDAFKKEAFREFEAKVGVDESGASATRLQDTIQNS